MSTQRIVVGITGASGIVLGQRLVEELADKNHAVHVIVSEGARAVAAHETDPSPLDVEKLAAAVYPEDDFAAPMASSSWPVDAVVICPCSMKTLSAIAHGYADNLVTRAAENCLKMHWPLVVVPRETPLSLPALENMTSLKRAGAIVLPPILGFYSKPQGIEDVVDFVVGKVLDALGIEHELYKQWGDGSGGVR